MSKKGGWRPDPPLFGSRKVNSKETCPQGCHGCLKPEHWPAQPAAPLEAEAPGDEEAAKNFNREFYSDESKVVGTGAFRGFLAGCKHKEARAAAETLKLLRDKDVTWRERYNKEIQALEAQVAERDAVIKMQADANAIRIKVLHSAEDAREELRAQVAEVITDRAKIAGRCADVLEYSHKLEKERDALKAALEKAEDVIRYYATPGHWNGNELAESSDIESGKNPVWSRGGKRAREYEALAKLENPKIQVGINKI